MKKQLISLALAVSALSLVSAQTPDTNAVPTAASLPVITGDATVDSQIRSLNQEMETKIRAIREDYQSRIQAIVGARRNLAASSSLRMRGDRGENPGLGRGDRRGNFFGSTTPQRPGDQGNGDQNRGPGNENSVRGAGQNLPQGNAWGFFSRFFGGVGGLNSR